MKKDLSFIERHFKRVEKNRQMGKQIDKQRNRKTQKQAERCKDRKA